MKKIGAADSWSSRALTSPYLLLTLMRQVKTL
jgi:hypothetical protein